MLSRKEITILEFIAEFRCLLYQYGLIIMGDRIKNANTLTQLGITDSQRSDYIANLIKADYSSGPEPDHSGDGEIWIFGKEICNEEIYIKIKIKTQSDGKRALCISFHIAQESLNYPFKN